MCRILFIFEGPTSYIESIKQQSGSSEKNICRYGTQKLPKNLNIYLCNYQTVTFLATEHEKTIMAYSYLNFFHTENTPKTAKNGSFSEGLLRENDFLRLFKSISVVLDMVPMLLRQFRRLAHGHCWSYCLCQLTKTVMVANFNATPMKKHI